MPPWSGVLRAAEAVWDGVKGSVPESCLGGPDERLNFAKHGRNRGDVEMTAVSAAEGAPGEEVAPPGEQPPLQREGSMSSVSTVGVEGAGNDQITEWQAGWNVTNAIQVTSLLLMRS